MHLSYSLVHAPVTQGATQHTAHSLAQAPVGLVEVGVDGDLLGDAGEGALDLVGVGREESVASDARLGERRADAEVLLLRPQMREHLWPIHRSINHNKKSIDQS